jgi:hypothetical protein
MAIVDREFDDIVSERKLSKTEMKSLAEEYRTKLYSYRTAKNMPYKPASINSKLSNMAQSVKRHYPDYYKDILPILIPPRDVKNKQIIDEKKRVWERMGGDDVLEVDYKVYKRAIVENKNSDNFYELCAVACLCSGRRCNELITANFVKIEDEKHHVNVSNLSKKRGDEKELNRVIVMPIIELTSSQFMGLIRKIRAMKPELLGKTKREISNLITNKINIKLKAMLANDRITSENVRSIYAEICFRLYNEDNDIELRYKSSILGHRQHDIETVARGYSYVRILNLDFRAKTEKKEKVKTKIKNLIEKEFSGLGVEHIAKLKKLPLPPIPKKK